MVTSSWLSGTEVKHPILVQEVPGLIPGFGKDCYEYLFCFVLLFCPKHILNVWKYRPIILNN